MTTTQWIACGVLWLSYIASYIVGDVRNASREKRIRESNDRNMASNREMVAELRKNTATVEADLADRRAHRAGSVFVSRGGNA